MQTADLRAQAGQLQFIGQTGDALQNVAAPTGAGLRVWLFCRGRLIAHLRPARSIVPP
jgi:hypothetical protein